VVGDIYSVTINFDLVNYPATSRFFYREEVEHSVGTNPCEILAVRWWAINGSALMSMTSKLCRVAAVTARKHRGNPVPKFKHWLPLNLGERQTAALTEMSAVLLRLRQGNRTSKHDGKVFVPGAPREGSKNGLYGTAFLNTRVAPWVAGLLVGVDEGGFLPGIWKLGVVSATVLNSFGRSAAGWDAAYSTVQGIDVAAEIAGRRTRYVRLDGAGQNLPGVE